jgi:hypothetical protein
VRDDAFSIWSDVSPQLSIGQSSRSAPKGWTLSDIYDLYRPASHIKLTCKYLGFHAIHFKFHDRIKQWPTSFQSVIPGTVQGNKRFCTSRWSTKLCPTSNKRPCRRKRLTFDRMHDQRTNAYKSVRGSWLMSITIILFTRVAPRIKSKRASDQCSTYFLLLSTRASPRTKSNGLLRYVLKIIILLIKFFKKIAAQQVSSSMVWLYPKPCERVS